MTLRLPPALVETGDALVLADRIDSTMEEARRRFAPGLRRRIWIAAGEQTAGRGRHGRDWVSPPGNLHLTLVLPTATPQREQPKFGFAAGVALARAARSLLPQETSVALKWPNDLLVGGAKAGGLLLEGLGGGAAVAIGVGVNIAAHPPETPYPATHLRAHAPQLDRETFFTALAEALVAEIMDFAEGKGFSLTRQRWHAQAAHLTRRIVVRQDNGFIEGRFERIDDEGRLELATEGGLLRIAAGDVFPLDK